MIFRNASVEDCGFIASLFDNVEYQLYFAENETTVCQWEQRFSYYALLNNYIVEVDGMSVGWVTFLIDKEACEIRIIVLKYDLIGKGLGYKILKKILELIPDSVSKIKLDVQKRNTRAVTFYKRFGFRIIGEEEQPVGDGIQKYYKMEYDVI